MAEQFGIALAAKNAARVLGVSERYFHLLRARPDFPAGHALGDNGGQVRWLRSELECWLSARPPAGLKPEPIQLQRGRVYRTGQQQGSGERSI